MDEIHEVVRTKRMEIVDDDGAVRILMAMDDRGDPQIVLSSRDTKTRIRLGLGSFGKKDEFGGSWSNLTLENEKASVSIGNDL